MEAGVTIPFLVWIIPFPVLKINFEVLGKNENHFVREAFQKKKDKLGLLAQPRGGEGSEGPWGAQPP